MSDALEMVVKAERAAWVALRETPVASPHWMKFYGEWRLAADIAAKEVAIRRQLAQQPPLQPTTTETK